jgi:hypothetical protein
MTQPVTTLPLVEQFAYGLDAPICLTCRPPSAGR